MATGILSSLSSGKKFEVCACLSINNTSGGMLRLANYHPTFGVLFPQSTRSFAGGPVLTGVFSSNAETIQNQLINSQCTEYVE